MTQADKLLGKQWRYSGDLDWSGCGGKWYLHTGDRSYHVIEFLNWEDACGARDAREIGARYNCSLSLVDLNAIPDREIERAKQCCDFDAWADRIDDQDLALAECCYDYGCKAPLWDSNGNNAYALVREARAESVTLRRDASAYRERMNRPVNALGSTAGEFMRGDIQSALSRGVYAGEPSARVMAKMYGIDQHVIDDARPDDFLPYVMGYMRAMSGAECEFQRGLDSEVSAEYFQGYDRGVNVRNGKCPAPGWIKTHI